MKRFKKPVPRGLQTGKKVLVKWPKTKGAVLITAILVVRMLRMITIMMMMVMRRLFEL